MGATNDWSDFFPANAAAVASDEFACFVVAPGSLDLFCAGCFQYLCCSDCELLLFALLLMSS